MKIHISRVHFPVTTLGPGRRVGIWLQGCSIRCPGCISADTWAFGPGEIEISTLFAGLALWLSQCDGVTISGGEPFDQSEGLFELLTIIKHVHSTNVLVFSGYSLERLRPALTGAVGLIDALVSDPFEMHASRTLALRGSDNQRLSLLTDLGHTLFAQFARPATPDECRFDIMFDEQGVTWMAGIPQRDDFLLMESAIAEDGHKILTSRARSGRQ